MVNGKIKKGEKAYETALREIKEETGLDSGKIMGCAKCKFFLFTRK